MFDYFYGAASEQFSFIRVPRALFKDEQFIGMSCEAKMLYGLFLDRMCLSAKHGWYDEKGRVFIIYPIDEIVEAIGYSDKKVGRLLYELEVQRGLIERKRQGLGKPNLIYVKNFIDTPELRLQNRQNYDSGTPGFTIQEPPKLHRNNTYKSNTDLSDTDSLPFTSFRKGGQDTKRNDVKSREFFREVIKDNIDYEILLQAMPRETVVLQEILELIVDVVCTTNETVFISGDKKPTAVVMSQFLKLNSEHIRFVIDGLNENTTRIRNMRQYLLATLYNAPLTMDNHYRSLLSHDVANANKQTL